MNGESSAIGWIIIIALAIFILVLNLGLFIGLKKKPQKDSWMDKMAAAGRTMKDPFKKENDQFEQLSQEIEKIQKTKTNNEKKESQ